MNKHNPIVSVYAHMMRFAVMFVLFLFTQNATAELLHYESFDDYPIGPLSDNESFLVQTGNISYDITAADMGYSCAEFSVTGGLHQVREKTITSGTENRFARNFSETSAPAVYVSYLTKCITGNNFSIFGITSSANAEQTNIGVGYSGAGAVFRGLSSNALRIGDNVVSSAGRAEISLPTIPQTFIDSGWFVVLKIWKSSGTTDGTYDRASCWINPVSTEESTAGTASTASKDTGLASLGGFYARVGSVNCECYIDEVRIGTSFADVFPGRRPDYISVDSKHVSGEDNTVTANITFTAPVETTATIYSGVLDHGISTNGWDTSTEFRIPADCGATNLVFPAVLGSDTIFRVYISGSDDIGAFFQWSDSQTAERSSIVRPYPGLTQVRYSCPSNGTPDFTIDFSTIASNLTDRTKGCIMGNKSYGNGGSSVLSDASESFTGTQWYWSDITTYGYEGEILLDAGTAITIGGNFDDGSACFIDGIEVFNQGAKSGYDQLTPAKTYTATYSGWHSFRAFVWDWSFGKDICRNALAGLQWNTNGVTDITKKNSWNKFVCGDDMTFLRTLVKDPSESYIAVNSCTASGEDNTVTVNITITAPAETTVTICSGLSDRGEIEAFWDTTTEFQIPADCGATNLVFPAVPGADTIFRVYISGADDAGDYSQWSGTWTAMRPVITPTRPTVAFIDSAFSTADLSCSIESFGDGYSSVDVSAIIATDTDFTQNVTTAAFCTLTETFVAATNAVSGLAPSTTYYVMLRAVNEDGYFAISDDVSFTTIERPYTYEDGVDVTGDAGSMTVAAEITGVYDGVTVTVSVFVNGVFKRSWNLTEPGTCSYTDAALSRDDYVLYTLTTELNNIAYPVNVEYSSEIYVSVGGDDSNSGLTLSKPKATVLAALDAVTKNVERIIVQPGTYTVTQTLMVTNAVTISGSGESRDDVILTGAESVRMVSLGNDNAVMRNLTISGVTNNIGVAYISYGVLDNCVLSDCRINNNKDLITPENNVGVVITNCLISGCIAGHMVNCGNTKLNPVLVDSTVENCSGTTYGGVCCGGSIYRCRIINNLPQQSPFLYSRLYDCLLVGNTGGEGILRESFSYNCTLVGNPGGTILRAGTHYNALIWGNMNGTNVAGYAGTPKLYNCLIDQDTTQATLSNCIIGQDPKMRSDYTLKLDSPCVDSGLWLDTEGNVDTVSFPNADKRTIDLAGNRRVNYKGIDIGCFEIFGIPTTIIFR